MIFINRIIDIRPFNELEKILKEKMPNKHVKFSFDNNVIISLINKLGYITLRYEHEIELFKKAHEKSHLEAKKLRESMPNKKVIKGNGKIGEQVTIASNLIILDVESFFIFARILLDKIPPLLGPLYKGIATQVDVSTINFKTHIDWFEKNSGDVYDKVFLEKMISFRKLFYEKLREPRNELIVHSKWDHVSDWLNVNGKIIRRRYKLYTENNINNWRIEESKELPEISQLFKDILEFLKFLNRYFSDKVMCAICS